MLDLNMSTVRSIDFSTSNPLNNIEHFDINLQNEDLSNLDGFSSSDKLYNKFLNDNAIEHYENLSHSEVNSNQPEVVEQPEPAVVEQPEPEVVEQPEPEVVEQPEPAVVEQPEPTVVEQPEPAVVEQPEPAVVEQPEPANDSDLVGAPLENEIIKAEVIEQEEMTEEPVNITPRQTEGGGLGSIMTFSLMIYLLYYIMKFTRV